jgi:hypothetical protein
MEVFICNPPFCKSYSIHSALYGYSSVRDLTEPKTPLLCSLA